MPATCHGQPLCGQAHFPTRGERPDSLACPTYRDMRALQRGKDKKQVQEASEGSVAARKNSFKPVQQQQELLGYPVAHLAGSGENLKPCQLKPFTLGVAQQSELRVEQTQVQLPTTRPLTDSLIQSPTDSSSTILAQHASDITIAIRESQLAQSRTPAAAAAGMHQFWLGPVRSCTLSAASAATNCFASHMGVPSATWLQAMPGTPRKSLPGNWDAPTHEPHRPRELWCPLPSASLHHGALASGGGAAAAGHGSFSV